MPLHPRRLTCNPRGGSNRRGGTLTRITSLIAFGCAALALAGSARTAIAVGVSEDRGKETNAAAFFATLHDLGLTENRVTVIWNPAQPAVIPQEQKIKQWLPYAQADGVKLVFAISSKNARDFSSASGAAAKFATFLQNVAHAFPQVKDYVIGNEPNQPYFWLPQFGSDGKPLSAAEYEPVLAQSYDALKSIDPTINVIGLGLSPRGNDNPNAKSNISRSPVRFLHDLGVAYRASGRTKPLMDELAYHPYPAKNTDAPDVGYPWPNAGLPNLDRLKQAVWDAFNGTAQPTFDETPYHDSFAPPLRLQLDELGWQVVIPPALAGLYYGTETMPTIDEATQAQYYADSITMAECDPAVDSLNFFLLVDEPDLSRWQSGLERIDGSHRPSYDAVKQAIAQTHGNCQGAPAVWRHSTQVSLATVQWGNLKKVRPRRSTHWSFVTGAREEATYRAGIFKAGTSRKTIARAL